MFPLALAASFECIYNAYLMVKITLFVVKKGQLGVWDYGKVHERIVYGNTHSCILNNMK